MDIGTRAAARGMHTQHLWHLKCEHSYGCCGERITDTASSRDWHLLSSRRTGWVLIGECENEIIFPVESQLLDSDRDPVPRYPFLLTPTLYPCSPQTSGRRGRSPWPRICEESYNEVPGGSFFRVAEETTHTKQPCWQCGGRVPEASRPLAPTQCPNSCPYYTANVTSKKLRGLSHLLVPPRCWLQWWVAPQESLHEVQKREERQMRGEKRHYFCPWKNKGLSEDASRRLASLPHTHSTAQLKGTKKERKGDREAGSRVPGTLGTSMCSPVLTGKGYHESHLLRRVRNRCGGRGLRSTGLILYPGPDMMFISVLRFKGPQLGLLWGSSGSLFIVI